MRKKEENAKTREMEHNRSDADGQALTSNQGVRVNDDQNSLKAGRRGPTLLEDFLLREKITHFDHERIPERVVHARGAAAHGVFTCHESAADLTRASFLSEAGKETPVFLRFSTVAGFRGSTDLARDVRGFAVKFYTDEGIFDMVGNNIPVFFIQDAIKFPDLVHAVKPEPHNEIPQAASAHDTFWDFISLMPESMHMIMWAMSDRAIPRSYRMMEGFGVHTFRMVDAEGKSRFVKFHFKPALGTHSVVWEEAQKISGMDPDFHRRDLFEAIEAGAYPEWELGVQVVEEEDADQFDFDLFDPTKLIPEEDVPVRILGTMTLNRNPDNYFAETEQVAFHPGHVVPGIDFSPDPLLQGRLFSYTDTQLSRLGSPNFHEIPINRSVAPVHNHQRDAHMRMTVNKGRVAYEPNRLGGGCPFQAAMENGGFVSHPTPVEGEKVRARGPKFFDHYTQARMFYISQSDVEQEHMVNALRFELSKVDEVSIRERMLYLLDQIHHDLASGVAEGLGLEIPKKLDGPVNMSFPAGMDPAEYQPTPADENVKPSPALSLFTGNPEGCIRTRMVAFLVAGGSDAADIKAMKKALEDEGAMVKLVAPKLGPFKTTAGTMTADATLFNTGSVLFDAVYVPGGEGAAMLAGEADAVHFVTEAYRHFKAVAATGDGQKLLQATRLNSLVGGNGPDRSADGVVIGESADAVSSDFIAAIAAHRHWARGPESGRKPNVPA